MIPSSCRFLGAFRLNSSEVFIYTVEMQTPTGAPHRYRVFPYDSVQVAHVDFPGVATYLKGSINATLDLNTHIKQTPRAIYRTVVAVITSMYHLHGIAWEQASKAVQLEILAFVFQPVLKAINTKRQKNQLLKSFQKPLLDAVRDREDSPDSWAEMVEHCRAQLGEGLRKDRAE